jgi:hypothetical protein
MGLCLKVPVKRWRLLCRFMLVVQLLSALVHLHMCDCHARLMSSSILVLGSAFMQALPSEEAADQQLLRHQSVWPGLRAAERRSACNRWGTFQYCAPPQFLASTTELRCFAAETLDICASGSILEGTFPGHLRGGGGMVVPLPGSCL